MSFPQQLPLVYVWQRGLFPATVYVPAQLMFIMRQTASKYVPLDKEQWNVTCMPRSDDGRDRETERQ
ncbi:septum formation topological specificity factor [Paenibacillus popilliae ATCC 14706]|uniref:Septum formation topological specificity factor n=1 Tax=Paenibacillus popilliae ATCC 14706 TaxID=1212764 RepID=M9M5K7_PAEPP|nr:septum formation topological specificity factor [Paenibacillus popilliae ATCC 14706]